MTTLPDWLTVWDHTADEGIVVRAETRPLLYARAAEGMFRLLLDVDAVDGRQTREVEVSADDPEMLMANWLSELNYLHQARRLAFGRFEVTSAGERRLTARVGGEPLDPVRHRLRTEIKAVTLHRLRVAFTPDGVWEATVLFDL